MKDHSQGTGKKNLQKPEGEGSMLTKGNSANILVYAPTDDIRRLCERQIENAEHWARRLIHETLKENYGTDYFDYEDQHGNRLIKSEIIREVKKKHEEEPNRYPRLVDALTLERMIEILCKDELYSKVFKSVFENFYPCGNNQLRFSLTAIKDVRNKLSHFNSISIREAEKAICYSHDFIDCLISFYRQVGKDKDYNVPTFTKLYDSEGRCHVFSPDKDLDMHGIRVRSGDVYRVEVEVDPTFDPTMYTIEWRIDWGFGDKKKKIIGDKCIDIEITNDMVGTMLHIMCHIITKREWHRYGWYDDAFEYYISTILPPISENY